MAREVTTLRLEADGADSLDLLSGGYGSNRLDLGFPMVREVALDAPAADGSIDTTSLSGPRIVTLGVTISPVQASVSRWQMEQRVKAFLNPRLRPRMFVRFDSADPELMMMLRASNLQNAVVPQRRVRSEFVAQWVCPSGILESATLHTETIYPGAGAADGLEFDGLEFDGIEFPVVDPPGTSPVVNAGDRNAYPVVRLFGPFGDEGNAADETTIGNETTGNELLFTGMGVSSGDYVEIDFRAKTIVLNGDGVSKYSYLSFPDSAWWALAAGSNSIAFRPDTFSGNAQAQVLWRDAYT